MPVPSVCVTVAPQLSVAVGLVQETGVAQFMGSALAVILDGQKVNTGGVTSLTVMVAEQVPVAPKVSVAVKVTEVEPKL